MPALLYVSLGNAGGRFFCYPLSRKICGKATSTGLQKSLGQAFFSRLPPLRFIQMWPQQLKTVSKGLPSLTSAWASL